MNEIVKSVNVNIPKQLAFSKFVEEIIFWWPKKFTWSNELIVDMKIGMHPSELCTEIGPNNFRCDWGTVIEFKRSENLSFKWQINIDRSPQPNPNKSSTVQINFISLPDFNTEVKVRHFDFQKHGADYEDYLKAMDSDQGWQYILKCFEEYVNNYLSGGVSASASCNK